MQCVKIVNDSTIYSPMRTIPSRPLQFHPADQETESLEEQKDGSVKINQVIYVEREGHKKIVIGKGGAVIKAISMAARKELAELLERPVHLFLFVKVRENWSDDPERYRNMGLELPKA